MSSVSSGLRRTVLALAAGALVLAGCATPVTGTAAPGSGEPVDVPADQLTITGATDNPIDQQVRDALTDINTFWEAAYPQFFGHPFVPLKGGYFSVDSNNIDDNAYPSTGIGCAAESVDPEETKDNAFYNPRCDAIAYDRALLSDLESHAGRALPPIVLAHEFGHAMQGRFGFASNGRSIQDETQADCFAGAWTAWVVAGHAQHVAIRKPELDDALAGYLTLSDPVGSDPEDNQAHGSYFDRLAAFSDGYDKGVATCRDDFGPDRVFTDEEFTSAQDAANNGNAPYGDAKDIVQKTLPVFWDSVFSQLLSKKFTAPTVKGFSGTAPSCTGGESRELGYCRSDKTVYFDEKDLVRPAYDKIGDWSVAAAISLPYALAARSELGKSTDDGAATRSAVCLTGWYTARAFDGDFSDTLTLSPGDVDEAVRFLLTYGVSDQVFPNTQETGFELLRSFRDGFVQGGKACDIGI
jgi:predicted metalloprotease